MRRRLHSVIRTDDGAHTIKRPRLALHTYRADAVGESGVELWLRARAAEHGQPLNAHVETGITACVQHASARRLFVCCRLDRMLDGGCRAGELTEFVGESACGRTQVC
jgi:hypothetical protein